MSNGPIAPVPTPDPWILQHNDTFYLTFTLGSHIEIWSSPSLEDFHRASTTRKSTIWRPSPSEHWSTDLWAPELHHLNGTWYIYTCAAPRATGNPGHRTILLRSHDPDDPMNPDAWTFLGPLQGLPEDQWSIDATVFTLPHPQTGHPRLYCCYSGWPLGDHSDSQQDLFLIRLQTPELAIPDTLTCISRATLDWERPDHGRRGVNEGPSFLSLGPLSSLSSQSTSFQGIVFSAHGSWGPDYKLGVLRLVDPVEPCRESAWVKRDTPLLVGGGGAGQGRPLFGPGHASFVACGMDETEVYCVYHATGRVDDGWENRFARVLRLDVAWFQDGALPVCCADGSLGSGGGGGGGMRQGQVRSEASGMGGKAAAMPVGRMTGMKGRIWGAIESRMSGQYRGYLDKTRRRF